MRALALCVLVGCSAGDDVPAPLISNIVPAHGVPGAVVQVHGSDFCQRPAGTTDDPNCDVAGTVHFGAAPATPASWMDTAILVEIPAGITGGVRVQVIAAGRMSNTVPFTVD